MVQIQNFRFRINNYNFCWWWWWKCAGSPGVANLVVQVVEVGSIIIQQLVVLETLQAHLHQGFNGGKKWFWCLWWWWRWWCW
jgi:hypothetical protein